MFSVLATPILQALPVCVFAETLSACLSAVSPHQVLSSVLGLCRPIGGKPCSFGLHVLLQVLLHPFPYVEKPLCPFL